MADARLPALIRQHAGQLAAHCPRCQAQIGTARKLAASKRPTWDEVTRPCPYCGDGVTWWQTDMPDGPRNMTRRVRRQR